MKIPAITIYQPWVHLLLIGAKGFETRTRPVPRKHLGQRIALHAAMKAARFAQIDKRIQDAASTALFSHRHPVLWDLPCGAVIGTAVLTGAYRIGEHIVSRSGPKFEIVERQVGSPAVDTYQPIDLFGDFTPGRWAWLFRDCQFLPEPVPARGSQGWWYWDLPDVGLIQILDRVKTRGATE